MNPRTPLTFLLLIPLLLSCSMQKYCGKRYPPEIITKDSTRTVEKIVYRDTTVYVTVPGESLIDSSDTDSTGTASSNLETSFAKSKAIYKGGRLFHELTQKDSLLAALIKNGIKERYIESFEGSRETSVIVKNELTGWQHTQIYAAWILAGITLIQFLWKKILASAISRLLKFFNKSRHPP